MERGRGSGASRGMVIGGGIVFAVMLLLGLAYTLGGGKPLSLSYNPVPSQPTVSGVCQTGKLTLRLRGVESIKDTLGNDIPIDSEDVGVYLQGQTGALDTITLNGSGSAHSTTGQEVDCNGPYHLIFPAAVSTTYYNTRYPATGEWTQNGDTATYPIVVDAIGGFDLTAQNGTSGDWQASGMLLGLVANTSNSKMKMDIMEANGKTLHGPFLVAIAYNPSNFTKIEVIGGTSGCGAYSCPSYGTVASYNNASTVFTYQKFFVIPGTDNGVVPGVNGVKANGDIEIKFNVVPAGICEQYTAGTAANCDFVVRTVDLGSRPKNGNTIQEYANSDSGSADMSATDGIFKVTAGS